MGTFLCIYDVRGIQKYIFRTNKSKEIAGASLLVRHKLLEVIKKEFGEQNCKYNWDSLNEFTFFDDDKTILEVVYEGGGNLVLAFRGDETDLINKNRNIQINLLKETYGLSVAWAYTEFENIDKTSDGEDYYTVKLNDVKEKLKKAKQEMSNISLGMAHPICKLDSLVGLPISEKKDPYFRDGNIPLETYIKLEYFRQHEKENAIKSFYIDGFFKNGDDDDSSNSDKTIIAVVHIDGNDMGAMINRYRKSNANSYISLKDSIKKSRVLSSTINSTFKVDDIIEKYNGLMVINSGDDITFICKATVALNLTKEIMEKIEEKSLSYDGKESNNFSSCAGICYCHKKYPFYMAYEIAEEVCSYAKERAKKYQISTSNSETRPSSYLDFEIMLSSMIDIEEIRDQYEDLYLRPYKVSKNENGDPLAKYNDINSLLYLLGKFNNKNNIIPRSIAKEIRNTYELEKVHSNILFERIKSRKSLDSINDEDRYNPFVECNGIKKARYYDSTSLMDLYDDMEDKNNEVQG